LNLLSSASRGDYPGPTGGASRSRGEGVDHVLFEIGEVAVQLVGALGLGIAGEVGGRRLLGDFKPDTAHQPAIV
jgi:hypothetical protein